MKRILPNLFFFFLSAPILSPQIGITIYIYAIVPLFDIRYWLWIFSNINVQKILGFLFLVSLITITGLSIMIFFKIVMLALTVSYCVYCYASNLFYLYRYAVISVLVAILQFILLINIPELARLIGPTAISQAIWGDYGTESYTNFYAISILPRVSGLCREGGFFASYLALVVIIAYFDKFLNKTQKRLLFIFLVTGLLFSLSKSTILLFFIPVTLVFRKFIKQINVIVLGITISIVASVIFSIIQVNSSFFSDSENATFIHRFFGYAYIRYAYLEDFFIGIDYPTFFRRIGNSSLMSQLNFEQFDFCGFPNIYLKYGIIPFLLFLSLIKKMGLSAISLILIFLLTITVSPWTCDNFVVLSWFLCICIDKKYLFNKSKVICQYT
jgi:hypothetical protein